jgi:hypothetical protein
MGEESWQLFSSTSMKFKCLVTQSVGLSYHVSNHLHLPFPA